MKKLILNKQQKPTNYSQKLANSADILIVDDQPESLCLLSTILGEQGYHIRSVPNGKLALNAIARQVPDLVLLDIKMPEMDGYSVCQHLKSRPETSQIPVIFISASSREFDKVKGFEVGGVDYITKPFEINEVIARVRTQICQSQLSKQLAKENEQLKRNCEQLQGEILSQKRIQQANLLFLQTISHDLRNSVIGSQIVLQSYLNREQSEYRIERRVLEMMLASCSRQEQLIEQLVKVREVSQQSINLVYESVSLSELVEQFLQTWQHQITESGAMIENRIGLSILPVIQADSLQLWRVLENLVGNALKYNESGIKIILTAQFVPQERFICCRITDNGVGIPVEQISSLFAPYVRGIRVESKQEKGYGLGL